MTKTNRKTDAIRGNQKEFEKTRRVRGLVTEVLKAQPGTGALRYVDPLARGWKMKVIWFGPWQRGGKQFWAAVKKVERAAKRLGGTVYGVSDYSRETVIYFEAKEKR